MSNALVKVDQAGDPAITDAATLLALRRLSASRVRLREYASELATRSADDDDGGLGRLFQPRSATLRALMSLGSLGATRLPWFRWAFQAFLMWRSLRRR